MKILHTSDWHLGRPFGPMSLRDAQERFCDRLVEVVSAERIDLVVVAGDIYDRAIAPNESIELFRETVRRLLGAGTVVAAITGNHDGADRVSPYDDLLDGSGLYIRGGYEGVGRVVTHGFADGPLDLVLVPFLDPQGAPDDFGRVPLVDDVPPSDDPLERRRRRTHASVLDAAFTEVRRRLTSPRSIAVAHAFVTGGSISDSERQLEVGGTGEVPVSLFDGFSYTALGHLHRPQEIDRPTVRYSGTPMPYSFSEDHPKSMVLVEMDPNGACHVDTVELSVGREVTTVRGTMDELLDRTRHASARDRFVRAIVTDRQTVLDAKAKLEAVYPHVVEIRLEPDGGPVAVDGPSTSVDRLRPADAVVEFWTDVEDETPDGELLDLLHGAVAAATDSLGGGS